MSESHIEVSRRIERDALRRLRGDGLIVDGTFYPHMVDGVRNPALEWRWLCSFLDLTWLDGDTTAGARVGLEAYCEFNAHVGCRWVAVGVKA
jgi:hypothetical protein